MGHAAYQTANHFRVGLSKKLPDHIVAHIRYRERTGEPLNLKDPRGFNEKLWWLKLNNRDPLMTLCSDKSAVREYVAREGYQHILSEQYGVYESPNAVDFAKLPKKELFFKTTHGSGGNLIVDNSAPVARRKFRKFFKSALKANYFWQSREWNYKDIPPRLVCEEVLRDSSGSLPNDFKFMCFDGEPRLLYYSEGLARRDGRHETQNRYTNIYDMDFDLQSFKRSDFAVNPDYVLPPKPILEEMQAIAARLSRPFVFCRVDLYEVDQRIYFGEITFFPAGASGTVEPEEWELRMGDWINLSSSKIKLKDRSD
ncbi:ATP-grasp fold amidoligase family protein [Ornithinimicrobium kibberense]|uniref:ATP-grasp fold amidoligase family protein n=1 Tax=Ornithinimicrobium kibberense TaxID=282060 RepID=UPI0036098958